jgi:hypothetical protein
MPITWTPYQDAELLRLRAEGLAFSAVAKRLGITRNSAIGRATRLDGRGKSRGPTPILVVSSPGEEIRRPPKPPRLRLGRSRAVQEMYLAQKMIRIAAETPVKMGCRWPEGDPRRPGYTTCGKLPLLSDSFYCHEHELRAYRVEKEA